MSSFYTLDLQHIQVLNPQAIDVDFSKARNYFIDPKYNDVKAMKVSLPEAGSFLMHLGLKLI